MKFSQSILQLNFKVFLYNSQIEFALKVAVGATIIIIMCGIWEGKYRIVIQRHYTKCLGYGNLYKKWLNNGDNNDDCSFSNSNV